MRYHNVTKADMLNGDGLRVVLWVSGCSHHCKNCHNPITWNKDDGLEFTEETWLEIKNELQQDYCSGITFSGGDPLEPYNFDTVYNIICRIRKEFGWTKTIWIYTGYTLEELYAQSRYIPLLHQIDILVDGEFQEEKKNPSLKFRGSENQRIIKIQDSLSRQEVVLYE